MSMGAKLNIVVDKLTGDYQDQLGTHHRSITDMYPSSPAILEINVMAITNNVRQ